ncbi:unnamed protein product [Paramecium sonneborni]|uniref:H-type lectin domain-containing protein n=1 Tax=Paramecium sonneborni TaxID=65129 RepID=A0A8S1QC89_9CILI|nr:unnamed protein product [Paramecium sonneborni]
MLILYFLIQKALSQNIFQNGTLAMECTTKQFQTYQVTFPNQFPQAPQIFFTLPWISIIHNEVEFRFETKDITTLSNAI